MVLQAHDSRREQLMNTQSKVIGGLAVLLAVSMALPVMAQEKKVEEK